MAKIINSCRKCGFLPRCKHPWAGPTINLDVIPADCPLPDAPDAKKTAKCPVCEGTGDDGFGDCPQCMGRGVVSPDIDRLTKENARLREVLEEIEWNGPSDYSIGVRTCPYCGRRGDVSKESKWWEGHSADCEIGKLLEATK